MWQHPISLQNAKDLFREVFGEEVAAQIEEMAKAFAAKPHVRAAASFARDVSGTAVPHIKAAANIGLHVDRMVRQSLEASVIARWPAADLLEYSDVEAQKILLNRLRKDRLLLNKISATNAYKELDDAVNAAQEERTAENDVITDILSQ